MKITQRHRFRNGIITLVCLFLIAAFAAHYVLEKLAISPRLLAPYIDKRVTGHNPTIVGLGNWISRVLLDNDRGQPSLPRAVAYKIGAQSEPVRTAAKGPLGSGRSIFVTSSTEALGAIAQALPGDVITFLPGRYHFQATNIGISRPGTEQGPITVRADLPGTVMLDFDMNEGFVVDAPYWTFENLTIKGVCNDHSWCEHAFHVVGRGHHFVSRNNTIMDFNAHFKINGLNNAIPDDGLIEATTLINSTIRQTANPVTFIDLVAASNWTIRKNFIADFFKEQGNQISYGAFVKGAGSNNLMENNIVLCEYLLRSPHGQRVGLSLGGGGTGTLFCRDKRCITEQDGSAIRGNLIASCSDDGIYINRSATSKIMHNTLIDTAGIEVRFPQSSADVEGNLIDGGIRARDQAVVRANDNVDTSMMRLYLGSHPVRHLFDVPERGSFRGVVPLRSANAEEGDPVAGAASRLTAAGTPDLCSKPRTGPRPYGAFVNFADCVR